MTVEREHQAIPADPSAPLNYRYLLDHAIRIGGRLLDYGCGRGEIVSAGRKRGLDTWGADTYSGHYNQWLTAIPEDARPYVRRIEGSRADFPDAHFDLVLSNQVLEHVTDPEDVIADMGRLLKQGGTLIAAFPVVSTWYEGHVGLYLAHRLPRGRMRHVAFVVAHGLGFGLYRGTQTATQWASASAKLLDDVCFYQPKERMFNALCAIGPVEDISVHYMRTRLGRRVHYLPNGLLRFIYHKRAGEIVSVVKAAPRSRVNSDRDALYAGSDDLAQGSSHG